MAVKKDAAEFDRCRNELAFVLAFLRDRPYGAGLTLDYEAANGLYNVLEGVSGRLKNLCESLDREKNHN